MDFRKYLSVKTVLIGSLIIFLGLVYIVLILPGQNTKNADTKSPSATTSAKPKEKPKEPKYPLIDLQPTVDKWAANQSGKASVVIYDLNNSKGVASLNPDEQYFTASIYKLYVAYIGYQKIADGTYDFDEQYLGEYTRGECLDEMIRSSYSPCAEKMWVELGKENIDQQIQEYRIENTSMVGLYTSAADTAIVLKRLHNKQDLTDEHTELFLDSLKDQPDKYRRGLPSGLPEPEVYNKVGWNLDQEWHDTAIVTLENGHSYVISVLTSGVGMTGVAELGQVLYDRMSNSGN